MCDMREAKCPLRLAARQTADGGLLAWAEPWIVSVVVINKPSEGSGSLSNDALNGIEDVSTNVATGFVPPELQLSYP